MTDGQDKADRARDATEGLKIERRAARYQVPDIYRHSIRLKVKSGGGFLPATLINFGRHGIMLDSTVPFEPESLIECTISAPQFMTKEISFSFRVKYCLPVGGSFEIGGEIETVADATWFAIFTEVHDFIIERKGTIY